MALGISLYVLLYLQRSYLIFLYVIIIIIIIIATATPPKPPSNQAYLSAVCKQARRLAEGAPVDPELVALLEGNIGSVRTASSLSALSSTRSAVYNWGKLLKVIDHHVHKPCEFIWFWIMFKSRMHS